MSAHSSPDSGFQPLGARQDRALDLLEERRLLADQGKAVELRELAAGDLALAEEAQILEARLERVTRTLDAPLAVRTPSFVALALSLRILRPLGGGGQGRVYLAFDETLKREVAVKTSHWKDSDAAFRLRKEAELASRLNHPGIVPIFGSGVTEIGLPFLVMRYVPGVTLERLLLGATSTATTDEVETTVRAALRAMSVVCRTVAHAHRCGVVHCDLKPGNVLVGEYGETALLDWGSASPFKTGTKAPEALDVSHGSTLRAQIQGEGTTEFMSPERIEGRGELGPWTDIYSIGAIIDRVLRGGSLASGDRRHPTGSRTKTRVEVPLHTIVKLRLRTIADLACASAPGERPKSAEELAEAIDGVLEIESLTRGPRARSIFRMFRRADG